MIGNTVQFIDRRHNSEPKIEGVILDKIRDLYSISNSSMPFGNGGFMIIDFYLVRLLNGNIIKLRPIEIIKIISFYNKNELQC